MTEPRLSVEYRHGRSAFTASEFVQLAQRVWPGDYDERRALAGAPRGRLFLGAQPGNEAFFEAIGFVRGPIGFVGHQAPADPVDG